MNNSVNTPPPIVINERYETQQLNLFDNGFGGRFPEDDEIWYRTVDDKPVDMGFTGGYYTDRYIRSNAYVKRRGFCVCKIIRRYVKELEDSRFYVVGDYDKIIDIAFPRSIVNINFYGICNADRVSFTPDNPMYCSDEYYHRVYLKTDETHALQFITKKEKLVLQDYAGGKLIRDKVLYGLGLASCDKLPMPLECWQIGKNGEYVYNDRVREIRVSKCENFYLNAQLDFPNLMDIYI